MRPPPEETGRLLASKIASKTPKIFTSDLKRAKRTAELYAAAMATTAGSSTPTEVEVEERLREPSLGKFEGMVKGDIYSQHAELFRTLASLSPQERLHKAYFEGLETPSETSLRVEALAAEVRRQGRCVSHWEPYDGSMSILEIQASTGLPAQDEARELLSDLYLLAPRGINVLLYVLPFGTVSEELMHRLVFLLQYLLGNEILLNLYVVVTEAPSSLQSSDDAVEWVQSFADQDSGFRHLFTLAGKNPSRFIILGKAIQEDRGSRLAEKDVDVGR
eukprot:g1522.t1